MVRPVWSWVAVPALPETEHRYKAAESKWRNGLLGDLYVAKMRNAGPVAEKDQARMKKTFMDKFKIDLGDFNTYEKNPVRKQVAKGPITAA